jgi:hypothetical protein
MYANGYRFSNDTSGIQLIGGVYVRSKVTGSTLSIDDKYLDDFGRFSNGLYIKDIPSGRHKISVNAEGFTNWSKTIYVHSGLVASVTSLLLPNPIVLTDIPKYIIETDSTSTAATVNQASSTPNPEYEVVIDLYAEPTPLATTSTSSITRNQVAVWVEGKTIVASWLGDPEILPGIFCIDDELNNEICMNQIYIPLNVRKVISLDFMPGRDDVLVIGTDKSVFLLEIDGRGSRGIHQIYSGKSPKVIVNSGTIYIYDTKIMAVVI